MARFALRLVVSVALLAVWTNASPLAGSGSEPVSVQETELHDVHDVFPIEKGGLTFHGAIRRRDLSIHNSGPFQPFPNRISAQYHVYDRLYKFDMILQPGFVDPDVGYTVYSSENGTQYRVWHEERHYVADNGEAKISAVVFGENSLHAIVWDYANDEIFNIESLDYSSLRLPENKRRALADTKVVAYRQRDIKYHGETCGTNHEHNMIPKLGSPASGTPISEFLAHGKKNVSSHVERRQVSSAYSPPPRATATECSTVISTARATTINFVVDWTYYNAYSNDDTAVTNSVNSILLSSNFVYANQFNVKLTLGTLYSGKAQSDSTQTWNLNLAYTKSGTRCSSPSIDTALNTLASWVAKQPDAVSSTKRIANWHHLTNCYPAPGTVGLAYVGTTCRSPSSNQGATNTGVSGYNGAKTWLTVAHELGHNYNGDHAFDQGQGTTGGIMDYGDGLYPVSGSGRTYRFHPTYNEAEMCTYLKSMLSIANCYGLAAAPVCGNGVVESGEECDDSSSCCNQKTCKLATGATCTGTTACCKSCQSLGSETKCTPTGASSASGFCFSGACTSSGCTSVSGGPYDYCPIVAANASTTDPCATSTCALTSNQKCQYTVSGGGLPDGAACYVTKSGTTVTGVCVSKVCTAVNVTPTPSPVAASATPSTSRSPSSTPSRSASPSPLPAGASPSVTPSISVSPAAAPSTAAATPTPSQSVPATVTFGWSLSTWTACAPVNKCGTSGSQTRTVTCKYGSTVLSDTFCTYYYGTKPATSQTCTATDPCTYSYVSIPNGACSTSCKQNMTVYCASKDASGTVLKVDDSLCAGQTYPATVVACTNCTASGNVEGESLYDGTWITTSFSSCQVYCGIGEKTRQVICNGKSCDPATQPAATVKCAGDACETPVWVVLEDQYTECDANSTACAQFSEQVTQCHVKHNGGTHDVVDDSKCPSNKPITVKQLCPAPLNCDADLPFHYVYASEPGTQCFDNCPNSYTIRATICVDPTGAVGNVTEADCINNNITPLKTWTDSCLSKSCVTDDSVIEEPSTSNSSNLPLIVGASVGGVAAIGIAAGLTAFFINRKKKEEAADAVRKPKVHYDNY